jgi:hypothetical protein
MPRILSIDYGKRTGIAVTDEMIIPQVNNNSERQLLPEEYFQKRKSKL